MKKLVLLLLFAAFISTVSFSQAPQAFAFQSTITDTLGVPLSDREVSVQFIIHSGSDDGPNVYTETHLVTTSANGYFSANVGQGDVDSGVFADISWGTSSYWLELAVDTTGGVDYASLGASQLLSVPYALNAGNNEPSIYFTGSLSEMYDGVPAIILFDVDINRGLAYNEVTGEFTVTHDGIYEIQVHINEGGLYGEYGVKYLVNGTEYGSGVTKFEISLELIEGDTISIKTDVYNTDSNIRIKEIK